MPETELKVNDPNGALSDKHVLFRRGQSWFSVPAISVREVTIASDLVRAPGCHRSLEGLCRQQSEFIPVISLDALFDIASNDRRQQDNQLITLTGKSVWAIRVSEVTAIESLETITSPEDRHDQASSSPIIGTAIFGDCVVRVLNPDSLYQMTSQSLEHQWAGQQPSTHPGSRDQQ